MYAVGNAKNTARGRSAVVAMDDGACCLTAYSTGDCDADEETPFDNEPILGEATAACFPALSALVVDPTRRCQEKPARGESVGRHTFGVDLSVQARGKNFGVAEGVAPNR